MHRGLRMANMARRDYFKQAQRRRYQTRSYRNPHLDGQRTIHWRLIGSLGGGVVVVIVLFFLLFGNPFFRFTHVEVTGTESLDKIVLEGVVTSYTQKRALLFFKRSNRFLFSSSDLSNVLKTQFALATISVSTKEGSILINLQERTPNLFWKTQNRLYIVDLEGIVVREINDPEDQVITHMNLADLPIFVDVNDVPVEVGASVLTQKEVEQAFLFLSEMDEANLAYTYIDIDRLAGKWVKLVTQEGFSILLDLTGDMDQQFKNLQIVLSKQVQDRSHLEYIDLRFGEKVYIK